MERPPSDYIYCHYCRIRVAYTEGYYVNSRTYNPILDVEATFHEVYNVEVPDDNRYHHVEDGNTLVDAYCANCGVLIGWKIIDVTNPRLYYQEGRFVMKLDRISYWNGIRLHNGRVGLYDVDPNDQDGGANEQVPNEQDLVNNDQNADQDGDATDEDLGTDDQNANQDGGANEQVPNEQDLVTNDQTADQHGDATEQDFGANEQNANQDGGANEQVSDEQDGGSSEQVPNEDVDITEGMDNIDINANI